MPQGKRGRPRKSISTPDLLLYKYENKRVVAKRQLYFRDTIKTCRTIFPDIPQDHSITLNTKDLSICENEMAVIAEDSWDSVVGQLKYVVVKVENKQQIQAAETVDFAKFENSEMDLFNPTDGHSNPTESPQYQEVPLEHSIMVEITHDAKPSIRARLRPGIKVSNLLNALAMYWEEDSEDLGLTFHGESMLKGRTLSTYGIGIRDTEIIHCINLHEE